MERGVPFKGHLCVPWPRPEVLDLAGLRGVVVVDGDSHGVRLGGSYARRHIAEEDEKLFIRLRDVVVDDPNADTLFAVRVGDADVHAGPSALIKILLDVADRAAMPKARQLGLVLIDVVGEDVLRTSVEALGDEITVSDNT